MHVLNISIHQCNETLVVRIQSESCRQNLLHMERDELILPLHSLRIHRKYSVAVYEFVQIDIFEFLWSSSMLRYDWCRDHIVEEEIRSIDGYETPHIECFDIRKIITGTENMWSGTNGCDMSENKGAIRCCSIEIQPMKNIHWIR